MRFQLLVLWISCLLLCGAARVRAQTATERGRSAPTLTSRGRLLIGGDVLGNWSNDGSELHRSLARWEVDGSIRLLHFVRDQIAIGASFGGGASARRGTWLSRVGAEERANHVSAGVHAAFNVPLAPRLSLLLQPAFLYLHQWMRVGSLTDWSLGNYAPAAGATFQQQAGPNLLNFQLGYLRLALSVPLLVHLTNSVGLGFGPGAWFDFIVTRRPKVGRELLQRPAYYEDEDDPEPRLPRPRRTRFQVGLFTTIVVAL